MIGSDSWCCLLMLYIQTKFRISFLLKLIHKVKIFYANLNFIKNNTKLRREVSFEYKNIVA